MTQIRPLTREQVAYLRRCYLAGWGLEPISARLPGIGIASLKAQMRRSGIALRAPGGYRKMPTVLPPPFDPADFRPHRKGPAKPSKPPPDPRVVAWHRPIWPGWRIHGEMKGKMGTVAGAPVP
jgi:hypothetical protein